MDVRNYLTFVAEFPDDGDQLRDEAPVPAGRNVAEAIAAALRQPDRPKPVVHQHSFYGWHFQCGPYWCLLQCPDSWLLVVEDRSSVIRRWTNRSKNAGELQDFLDAIHQALRADARFSEMRWCSIDEYEGKDPI